MNKIIDWPFHLSGEGTPCQPQAYHFGTRRLAIAEGVTAFPKALAKGLEVKLNTEVQEVALSNGCFTLKLDAGSVSATKLFISCPLPQTIALLKPLAKDSLEVQALLTVFKRVTLLPCLTVIAGYQALPEQSWQILLPGPAHPLHSIINDSSKRPLQSKAVLVIQAAPQFSRQHLHEEPQQWSALILKATANLLGEWVKSPLWMQAHPWEYARVQRGDELSHPVLLRWPTGQILGICGDAFNPRGGVEGAYLSGAELAHRDTHNIVTDAVS
jgi:predicted NAD/FAD-dependent oxidoreductase